MTIELTPTGVGCNLDCQYCYQKPMRDAGNISIGSNIEKMLAGLEREGGRFSVFGGEPLLTPIPTLEKIFEWGLQKYGGNGIQSNGALITDEHITMFKKYKVHVGLSLDGPGELNDSRWAGSLEKTRAATIKSFNALRKLVDAKLSVSVITTLYQGNARTQLPKLLAWFDSLATIGVNSFRLHLLEVENEDVRREMALTPEENLHALLTIYEHSKTSKAQFDLFEEMKRLLQGDDNKATCVWHACDPYTTAAVRGVNGQGESSNCGRTNKEGVNWQKAGQEGFERQVALYTTPQSEFGCQDCRFFYACKGHCPGTAVDGDWRNRTEHCSVWMGLFERIESDLQSNGKQPFSFDPIRPQVERLMVEYWSRGRNLTIVNAIHSVRTGTTPTVAPSNQQHGDHWDAPDGYQHSDAPYVVHGDAGTTVMHGDSDAS